MRRLVVTSDFLKSTSGKAESREVINQCPLSKVLLPVFFNHHHGSDREENSCFKHDMK